MCFISKNLNKKIAPYDITVYKVLFPKGIFEAKSPVLWYTYRKYKKNERVIIKPIADDWFIIYGGYHSYITVSESRRVNGTDIYEAVIPAGTVYYESDIHDECVSENIILKRRLTYRSWVESPFKRILEKTIDSIVNKLNL